MVSNYFQQAVSELNPETEIFVKHYLDITTCILDLMEKQGMTQKDFADALNKNASEINRWLKSEHNLTLKTLSKIEALFGVPIIQVYKPSISANVDDFKRTKVHTTAEVGKKVKIRALDPQKRFIMYPLPRRYDMDNLVQRAV
jgi:transcriptional regulator with XRE-family HTH domain